MYQQGADAAYSQVLQLITHSAEANWREAKIPDTAGIPHNFRVFYKVESKIGTIDGLMAGRTKQRLNVRVEIAYEGMASDAVADFFWSSLPTVPVLQRLYKVRNIGILELACDVTKQRYWNLLL